MLIPLWLFKEASQIVLLLLLTIKMKKETKKKIRQLSGWEMQIATQKYHGRLLYNILDKNISTASDEKSSYPRSKRLCKTNKTWNEWECLGRVADHYLSWAMPHTELGARLLLQKSRAVIWLVRQVSHGNQIFHDESLWKFSFNFAPGTFCTDSNDRYSFLSFVFFV